MWVFFLCFCCVKVEGWTPDGFFSRLSVEKRPQHCMWPNHSKYNGFGRFSLFPRTSIFRPSGMTSDSILKLFWEPWDSFLDFLESREGIKIQKKTERQKRSPKGPGMSAGSNVEKCVGPKRRASSHQEGPRPRRRPDPEPNQSPYPDQTQNQTQSQRQRQRTET